MTCRSGAALYGALVLALAGPPGASVVTAQSTGLTLAEAVRQALATDPATAAARAEGQAAGVSIDIARQAYLPRVDALVQVNRATHNNVSGLLFPQGTIAPISGPPALRNMSSSVWGTALGALVSWEPFDFGARAAAVDAARHDADRAVAAEARTRLESAAAAADAYLSALAAEDTITAATAAVERAAVVVEVVEALVTQEIRPGLDLALARAEHAAAAMQVSLARRARDHARARLAVFVGDAAHGTLVPPAAPPAAASTPAAQKPASSVTAEPGGPTARHPTLVERAAATAEAGARVQAAARSADPVVALQGTVYGRGTGVLDDNSSGSGADGLNLEAYNWAVGLTLSVPVLEWRNKLAREAREQRRLEAARAREDEAARELTRRLAVARADETAAREVATQAALVLDAARQVEAQAGARYRAGLSTMTDVADAQRRLAQADIDAALAGLAIWRAHLAALAASVDGADTFLLALP